MRPIGWHRHLGRSRRGGVLLDAIVAFGIILIGAFLLSQAGLSFHQLLHGAERFFGS
jgi:hypothetical protein